MPYIRGLEEQAMRAHEELCFYLRAPNLILNPRTPIYLNVG